jgi:predicted membrane protein
MAQWAKDANAPSVEELEGAKHQEVMLASNYLLYFMIAAMTLEILDLIFRGYTQVKSWDILREVIMERDFVKIFIMQYTIGNLIPFLMMILPGRTVRRTTMATVLVLFGVFMMRYNVVIGGQAFSLSFAGFMDYHLPIIPHNWETFKEGLCGALTVIATPFVLFYFINKFLPAFLKEESTH